MQIPILNGTYADENADFRTSYPRNLVPVPKKQGISNGYLRPADGIQQFGELGPGLDRGGFNWNGLMYRVMGTSLIRYTADGTPTILGDVGTTGKPVTFDPSFDLLGISSGGLLFYFNPETNTVTQVTDPDLGTVIDFIWVDGYFMTTDGTNLVVTELTDPFSVNPLKYGSSEVDPDPVVGLLKLKNEPYALNRYTIEVYENVGGNFFPFRRIDGAQIQKGVLGTYAACVFMDAIAFLGSGRNESPAIYIGLNSVTRKISTREIDQLLQQYSEVDLSLSVVEARVDKGHNWLYVHLPDQTLVYDGAASVALEEAVWFSLSSSVAGNARYRARYLTWCYDKWISGDTQLPGRLGYFVGSKSSHYGEAVGWEFGTLAIYNKSQGAIVHELELVCLPGRVALEATLAAEGGAELATEDGLTLSVEPVMLNDPSVFTSYSIDGETWSQEKPCKSGKQGERNKRIHWLGQGILRNWRVQRFRGTSDCHTSFARLEARLEALKF